MPKIKIDYVVSFSSEDPVHVANNILLDDPAKKWKCKSKGEISATLILQLEKASLISGIDIGNEHSAYIEVLVSRSGSTDDYKLLLIMSSFMTSSDAKSSKNINEVKMFTKDQLQKPACNEKWDRVKIICTQPFNRHVQYGLSFIRLQTSGDRPVTPQTTSSESINLNSDFLKTGSLFNKWKEQKKEPVSLAAAIREASNSGISPNLNRKKIVINPPSSNRELEDVETSTPLKRNRKELLYNQDEEAPNEKIDKLMEQHKKELKEKQEKEKEKVDKEKEKKREVQTKKVEKKNETQSKKERQEKKKVDTPKEKKRDPLKRKLDPGPSGSPQKKAKKQKPFSQLLSGVVLVISGIQNPDRANLRKKALEMGAKYNPDWNDHTCTHLICAFVNTPKFKQVQGKGKIVTKKWIEECHSQRKRLPWRRFCLDNNDKNSESEDEISEEIKVVEPPQRRSSGSSDNTDIECFEEDAKMQEEIQSILEKNKAEDKTKQTDFDKDTDEDLTDVENNLDNGEIIKKLPNFFFSKSFYVNLTELKNEIKKYIIAYNGKIVKNPDNDTNFFICDSPNVENLKKNYPSGTFLRPDWIWECHNKQSLIPEENYTI